MRDPSDRMQPTQALYALSNMRLPFRRSIPDLRYPDRRGGNDPRSVGATAEYKVDSLFKTAISFSVDTSHIRAVSSHDAVAIRIRQG
jgi:hypothetical protein